MADGHVNIKITADGQVVKDLNTKLRELEKGAGKAELSLGKMLSALGVFKAVNKAAAVTRTAISNAFGRIDTMEQFSRTIMVITGNTKAAGQSLERLKDITRGTAYGLDVAAKSVQDLVTRGMDIGKATEQTAIWMDAVAMYADGTNEAYADVMDALGNMRATGKVTHDQLRRLQLRGINPVLMYAQAHNKSEAEIKEALSRGEITVENFIDTVSTAMAEGTGSVTKIAGAAKNAGASWSATFANMQAYVTRGMVKVVEAIDKGLEKMGFPTMRKMLKEAAEFVEDKLNELAQHIPGIMQAVVDNFEKVKPYIPIISQLSTAVGTFVVAILGAKQVKSVLDSVTAGFKTFGGILKRNPLVTIAAALAAAYVASEEFRNAVNGIVQALEPFKLVLIPLIGLIGTAALVYGQWESIMLVGKGVILGFKAAMVALNFVMNLNPVFLLVAGFALLTAGLIWAYHNCEQFRNTVNQVFSALGSFFSWLGTATVELVGQIGAFFGSVWEWIVDKWNTAPAFFMSIWDNIVASVSSFGVNIWNAVTGAIQGVIDFFVGLPAKAYDWGKDLIQSFIDGINSLVGSIGNFLGGLNPMNWFKSPPFTGYNFVGGTSIPQDEYSQYASAARSFDFEKYANPSLLVGGHYGFTNHITVKTEHQLQESFGRVERLLERSERLLGKIANKNYNLSIDGRVVAEQTDPHSSDIRAKRIKAIRRGLNPKGVY